MTELERLVRRRTRTTYRAMLSAVFQQLADWHAATERRHKREQRKAMQ